MKNRKNSIIHGLIVILLLQLIYNVALTLSIVGMNMYNDYVQIHQAQIDAICELQD